MVISAQEVVMNRRLIWVVALFIACVGVSKTSAQGKHLTRARMKSIVFEEVDFRAIRFSDAVEYLKKQSVERDPRKKGINVILRLDPARNPEITLHLGKSSMYKVMGLITEVAEYNWRYIGETLVLEPKPKKSTG